LSVIVCSAHLEAGHDWMEDCPAKRDSARCVRAAVGLLQRRFGERVPIFVAGDFNAQKTQLHHRLLTGEGAGIVRGFERLDDAAKDAAKTKTTKKTRAARGASEKTPEKEKAVTTTKKGFFQSDSEDASSLTRRTQKRDGDGDEGSPPGDEGSFGERIVFPKESFDAERRRDLVDVFDALAEDNPNASFESTDKGVRSGGHRGTTWHDWRGPDWACMISSTMAKHGKHHSQLTYFDRAEVEVSEPATLTTSGRSARVPIGVTSRLRAWRASAAGSAGLSAARGPFRTRTDARSARSATSGTSTTCTSRAATACATRRGTTCRCACASSARASSSIAPARTSKRPASRCARAGSRARRCAMERRRSLSRTRTKTELRYGSLTKRSTRD
jgi:hypothetical protein